MEPKERRQIGGHYTSGRDILKVIRPLFLDELRAEFERTKRSTAELRRFHRKLAGLRFLDPACGCGNFLVVTYRELRLLEIEVVKLLYGEQKELDVQHPSRIDVDAFYGIEISEWPARIAEVAMWLMDHQMNQQLSYAFPDSYYARLPLRKSPKIVCDNALRLDWKKILPSGQCSYVLGNPPFGGKQFGNSEQKLDMQIVCGKVKGGGILDYVAGWYIKAGEYIQGTAIEVAFVSTNSITQGEQVGILWNELFSHYHLKIHFAHRTFAWESEARGKAHVHVVIIGFGVRDASTKRIYEQNADAEQALVTEAGNISPYLIDGNDVVVSSRARPVSLVPEIVFGSMPNDGGNLLFNDSEKDELIQQEPAAAKFIRPFLGSQEFINGERRWCLWLKDALSSEIRVLPRVMKRIEAVRKHRFESPRETTRELAKIPTLFGEIRQPECDYLLIPGVSSENRLYIPIGFMPKMVVGSNLVLLVPGATTYHFGVLSSAMHMAWVRQVCGRLESRYRYSNRLVYNNFPWPIQPTNEHQEMVREKAETVLTVREKFRDQTLAELYDPLAMPSALVKAHAELDRAVDRCYRSQPFESDRQRIEYLFALYEKLTAPLIAPAKKGRRKAQTAIASS